MKSAITVSLVAEARGGPFVYWDDLPAACREASELGFDAVEIFPPGPEAIDATTIAPELTRTGLNLAAVGTGAGWVKHRLTLTDPDPAIRAAAVRFVETMIEAAAALGAPVIIGSMQGRSGPQVSPSTARDHLRRGLDTLAESARRRGVPLIYEPLNRYETNLCNTLADGVQLLESLSSDNVVLLADLFHMNLEESQMDVAIRDAGRRIGHVHFVDSNRHPPGAGHLDFPPLIQALAAIGYAGYLSAEALPLPDTQAAARRTIDAFRRLMGPIA